MRATTTTSRGPVVCTRTRGSRHPRNRRDSHTRWTKRRGPVTLTSIPDNRDGKLDHGWLGQHQTPSENETGLQPLIEMGARTYNPILGRFLQDDPIDAGGCNEQDYVCADPINSKDLTGRSEFDYDWVLWAITQWGFVNKEAEGAFAVQHPEIIVYLANYAGWVEEELPYEPPARVVQAAVAAKPVELMPREHNATTFGFMVGGCMAIFRLCASYSTSGGFSGGFGTPGFAVAVEIGSGPNDDISVMGGRGLCGGGYKGREHGGALIGFCSGGFAYSATKSIPFP